MPIECAGFVTWDGAHVTNGPLVPELYAAIIGGTAAQAVDHLRDPAGLQSALGRPAMHAHYEAADLALQAAVLARGIAD